MRGGIVSDSRRLGDAPEDAHLDGAGSCWCGLRAGHGDVTDPEPLTVTASRLLAGDRQAEYGDAADTHRRIAAMWNQIVPQGARFRPVDVALAMIAVKIIRAAKNPQHMDSWTDIVGYAQIGADMSTGGDVR